MASSREVVDEVEWEEAAPLLLISHGGEGEGEEYSKQSFCMAWEWDAAALFYTTTIPMMSNKRIIASTHGLLVLVNIEDEDEDGDGDGDCWVWDPLSTTDTIIPLPRLPHRSEYHACLVTKPPALPIYHILFLHRSRSKLAYCAVGDPDFTTQALDHDILAVGSFRDRIYGVRVDADRYTLLIIDFVGNGLLEFRPVIFELERFNISSRPWHGNARVDAYLVACDDDDDDELFLVRMSEFQHCREFRVFRVDPHKMTCVEAKDIGGRTIFIAESAAATGFCCKSSNKLLMNCIYYLRGKWNQGSSLYRYNLDGTTTPLLPLPEVHPTFTMATWVQRRSCRHLLP